MKSVHTDLAYEFIRKRILSGTYVPGKPLMTELLAKEINISRTPVRDALRKLETDGLVTIQAHLGASVKKMEYKEFREMCDLRLALECHAAGLAALNHTSSDLDEIGVALQAMRNLTERMIAGQCEQNLISDLMREDVRFHIAIMTAANNELMKKEILRFHLINRVVSGPNIENASAGNVESIHRRRAILSKHEDIYNCVARSDAPGAKKEMEYHLQDMIDHSLRLMARNEVGVLARELTVEELAYSS